MKSVGRRRGARQAGGKPRRSWRWSFPHPLPAGSCPPSPAPRVSPLLLPSVAPSALSSSPAFCSPLHSSLPRSSIFLPPSHHSPILPISHILPSSLFLLTPSVSGKERLKSCLLPQETSQSLCSDGIFQIGGRPVRQRCSHSQKPRVASVRGPP